MRDFTLKYILDDEKRPVPTRSVNAWGEMMEDIDRRRVGFDEIGDFQVSTVFIGIDHASIGEGPPLLFETMVFAAGTVDDRETHRYSSWDDALIGHQATVRRLKEEVG